MLLLKKIKRNKSYIKDDARLKISSQWIVCQRQIAAFLQQRSELLSAAAKKVLSYIFLPAVWRKQPRSNYLYMQPPKNKQMMR